jgi:hypothetical protein
MPLSECLAFHCSGEIDGGPQNVRELMAAYEDHRCQDLSGEC